MREIVLCDIRQAENQEALVVKSSMKKKVLLFDRVQESRKLNPFFKKRKEKRAQGDSYKCHVLSDYLKQTKTQRPYVHNDTK